MEGEKLDWLNAEYIQKILRKYENDSSILVTSLTSERATAKGDNYGSIMIRVKVSYSSSKSGVERNEKRSLVIKSTPSLEGVQKEMLGQCSVFENEIRMMETTLERMNEIVNEDDFRFQARVLHSQIGDPSLLVMEDLTALGFRVANRRTGLDFDHCVVALQGLAKFHASSVALYEKDPSSMATYNYGIYHKDQPQGVKDFFTMATKQVAKEVDTWDELGPSCHSYSKKLMEFTKICFEETEKIAKPKEGDFNVLNHGDFWVTNMLFRYDANGKINGHIFADFQMPFYTSPAIDLLYFFATSSSEDVELNHQDVLIEKYLEALMSTLQKLGCRTKPPTLDELKASMKERELYALMSSCAVLPIVVVDESHVTDFNGLIERRDDNPMYKGLRFRKIMVRRLPYYDSLGLFNS